MGLHHAQAALHRALRVAQPFQDCVGVAAAHLHQALARGQQQRFQPPAIAARVGLVDLGHLALAPGALGIVRRQVRVQPLRGAAVERLERRRADLDQAALGLRRQGRAGGQHRQLRHRGGAGGFGRAGVQAVAGQRLVQVAHRAVELRFQRVQLHVERPQRGDVAVDETLHPLPALGVVGLLRGQEALELDQLLAAAFEFARRDGLAEHVERSPWTMAV